MTIPQSPQEAPTPQACYSPSSAKAPAGLKALFPDSEELPQPSEGAGSYSACTAGPPAQDLEGWRAGQNSRTL